ncbi:hypothetical protein BT96DRAFT_940317 [Gymnopus androsaceus JB14]|uniref:Uncharacterized protein n=1 Tax=Gymnopus androsaceus JB14 TaxID=1447944 RepID=A0A6A4HHH6_9AGAR|nr:hypothetical protein BT96DRAFT_940317 [Gymnopus androsaceus JB14]
MAGSCPVGPQTPVTCDNLGICPALTRQLPGRQGSDFYQDRIGGLLPGKIEHRPRDSNNVPSTRLLKSQLSWDKDELAKSRGELRMNSEWMEVEVRMNGGRRWRRSWRVKRRATWSLSSINSALTAGKAEGREGGTSTEALKSVLRVVEGNEYPGCWTHTHTDPSGDNDVSATSDSYALLPQTGSTISLYHSTLQRGRDTFVSGSMSRSRPSSSNGIKSSSWPGTPHERLEVDSRALNLIRIRILIGGRGGGRVTAGSYSGYSGAGTGTGGASFWRGGGFFDIEFSIFSFIGVTKLRWD